MTTNTSWGRVKWGDLATLEYGKALRGYKDAIASYPVYGTNGPIGWHDTPLCAKPGIIIGRKGAYRGVYLSDKPFFVIDTAFYLNIKSDKVDLVWAYYQLRDFDINSIDSGSAIPSTSREAFYQIPVNLPPLPTQHKITSVLSAYDALIENNTRRIEILEEMAQAIYREWFVNFRFPGHEKIRMMESELGPIPEGWEVKKVSEVASVYRGRSYRSSDIVEEDGLPFLNLKCVDRDGGFRREGIRRYQGPYKETQTAKSGDIIMAVTDMTQERRIIARAARVPAIEWDTSVFSMDLVKIEPNADVAPEYLYGMLRFSTFPDEVKQHANGANVLHLNPSHIEGYGFVLPPAEVSNHYAEICSYIYRQSDLLNSKNDNLHRTRDLLLPKLISGEVSVENLDIAPEATERIL